MSVQLVASCTGLKRPSAPADLQLRNVPAGADRASRWLERLARDPSSEVTARNLYIGEHWRVVRELEDSLRGSERPVALWVASAGYGLVSAKARLKPYSATFDHRDLDGVPVDEASAWWDALCTGQPQAKTLQSVVTPADTLVVIASHKYLRAVLPDLCQARQTLADPSQLIVFSGSRQSDLESSMVVVDDRVQMALAHETESESRGTKQSLAARTARQLLTTAREWPPTASAMKEAYDALVTGAERPRQHNRDRHGDEDVRAFIAERLAEDPKVGWTKLLRSWRDRGQACEQKRFRGLYQAVKAEKE